jgi:hypothetical protein
LLPVWYVVPVIADAALFADEPTLVVTVACDVCLFSALDSLLPPPLRLTEPLTLLPTLTPAAPAAAGLDWACAAMAVKANRTAKVVRFIFVTLVICTSSGVRRLLLKGGGRR